MRLKSYFFIAVGLFFSSCPLSAAGPFPGWKVVPWNGHKAATSLTFDDGDPSQLDVAVPDLDQRHMKGTFFLIANHIERKDDWRKVLADGHEIGNHTLDHKHANELTPGDEESQVDGALHVLKKEFGIPIYSFAYPYAEITPGLRNWVEKTHLLARGGGDGPRLEIMPDQEPDWFNIPSRATLTGLPLATYQKWIKDDYKKGGWLVWMIHGLEGTKTGWEPISRKNFEGILDGIQSKDIWVGTFLEVGAYLRDGQILEKAQAADVDAQGWKKWTWEIPQNFARETKLKIRFDKKIKVDGSWLGVYPADGLEKTDKACAYVRVRQGKTLLRAGEDGSYSVDFDPKELEVSVTYVNADGRTISAHKLTR